MSRKTGTILAALASVGAIIFAFMMARRPGGLATVQFAPFDLTTFSAVLTPLIVISVLIERALEVFFGITLGPEERKLEERTAAARRAVEADTQGDPIRAEAEMDAAKSLASQPDAAKSQSGEPADPVPTSPALEMSDAMVAEAEHEASKTRLAYLSGGAIAILVSTAGIRVIAMMLKPGEPQSGLLQLIDVFLTAGLLAGGADGFHRITAVISAFLKATQKNADDRAKP